MNYLTIEPWYEPRMKFEKKPDFAPMMSREDHAFLCGMLRKKETKKIVELGVAAGGTTLVIMAALRLLNRSSELFSVDISERFYADTDFKTGYLYDMYKSEDEGAAKQTFMLGKNIAEELENITGGQNDIDFVILDTAHYLPGEMLDFLCLLPYMSDGAVVVLHDVMGSSASSGALKEKWVGITGPFRCICTQLLFSVVSGIKYMNYSSSNIAAFEISEETRKNIADVFMALDVTWGDMPRHDVINKYGKIIEKEYDEYCLHLFRKAVKDTVLTQINIKLFLMERTDKIKSLITLRSIKKAAVWGLGKTGEILIDKLLENGVEIVGTIDMREKKYGRVPSYKSYKLIPSVDALFVAFRYDSAVDAELKESGINYYWIYEEINIFDYNDRN